MAKNAPAKAASRIRFIMVEAEIGDGDLGQITQAIQNALRNPVAAPIKRLAAITPPNGSGVHTAEPEPEAETEEEVEDENVETASAKPRTQRKPPAAPKVVTNMDMNSDVSLETFARNKDISSNRKKYLVAAAWLKEHRGMDGVTPDHIYTCFRKMGWSVRIADFAQPLRSLKADGFFTQNDNSEYLINHLGIDVANKSGSNGAA